MVALGPDPSAATEKILLRPESLVVAPDGCADAVVAPTDGGGNLRASDEGLATLKSSGYALSGGGNGSGCSSRDERTSVSYACRALDEGLATLKSSGSAHWGGGTNQVQSEATDDRQCCENTAVSSCHEGGANDRSDNVAADADDERNLETPGDYTQELLREAMNADMPRQDVED